MVERIVHLGFEVRVEFTLPDGEARLGPDHARRGRGARAADGQHSVAAPGEDPVLTPEAPSRL